MFEIFTQIPADVVHVIFLILVIPLALFFEGIFRKLNARFQNRIGPPILQPFYDMKKLWGKKRISFNDIFFLTAPLFYFITIFALFLFIPFQIFSFNFDFILMLYLTILAGAFYILSGVSSDSPFAIIGSMREMKMMIVYEITIAIIIFTFMLYAGVTSLASFQSNIMFFALPLSSICLIAISFVELHITPFDSPEATTEIMHGAETEYSSKCLMFMELGKYMKRLFYILLIPFFIFGTHDWILFALIALAMLFIFTISQATTARYRIDQAFKVYFVIMFLALIELVLVMRGLGLTV